jgi:hypothetical protein
MKPEATSATIQPDTITIVSVGPRERLSVMLNTPTDLFGTATASGGSVVVVSGSTDGRGDRVLGCGEGVIGCGDGVLGCSDGVLAGSVVFRGSHGSLMLLVSVVVTSVAGQSV